jgi:hypothetical protein
MNCAQVTPNRSQQSSVEANKIANTGDLDRIEFTIFDCHSADISNKSRALLSLVICLVKLGYTGIKSPIDALNRALYRSSGYSCSTRTLFRALSELESRGFIYRSKYRVGDDRFSTLIHLNLEAFSFWTRKRSQNISPIPTLYPKSSQLTNWQKDAGTSTHSRVNSRKDNIYNKPRARASRKYSKWVHPIIFTIGLLMRGPARKFVLARATLELEMGGDVAGHSGVPWSAWPRWQEMDKGARENIARNEIIPRLLDRSTLATDSRDSLSPCLEPTTGKIPTPQSRPLTMKPTLPMTPNQIAAGIAKFSSKFEPVSTKPAKSPENISLDISELEILSRAKSRARGRQFPI